MSREFVAPVPAFATLVLAATSMPEILVPDELYLSVFDPSSEPESLPNSNAPNCTSKNPMPLLTASPGISTALDGIFDGGGTRGRCFGCL